MLLSGTLAGLGWAHLALGDLSQFVERMTAGRGFIALAALIFGKWHPLGVLGACLFSGFAEAVEDGLQGWTAEVPSQVFLALPFVLTMVVLAGFVGRSRPPGGLGGDHLGARSAPDSLAAHREGHGGLHIHLPVTWNCSGAPQILLFSTGRAPEHRAGCRFF